VSLLPPQYFEYLKVDLLDTPEQDFLAHYAQCEEFIDRGRAVGKVLVHWWVLINVTVINPEL